MKRNTKLKKRRILLKAAELKEERENQNNPNNYSSSSSESEKPAKRKRKTRSSFKDPFTPKRPLSAWNFYLRENHTRIKEEHPEWKLPDFISVLGKEWKALTKEEKAPYIEMNLKDKKRYKKEYLKYEEKKSERKRKKSEEK
eukprot:TRINITY_DN487_c0_g1_i3.p1 TRINITY_DN487_c0_g1~~TRINITY_DN487_c0_g1_i3.p1  ORF type:complete len:142 (-),score=39.12 TRINITY_DN487_c0_g1_i3:50-475(-)